jgi:hypothetical protein
MYTSEHLVEQHIREYQSRLKHFDELFTRNQIDACRQAYTLSTMRKQLQRYKVEQGIYASYLDEVRLKSLDHWKQDEIAKAGPMAVWDIIALQLEGLVERITHH